MVDLVVDIVANVLDNGSGVDNSRGGVVGNWGSNSVDRSSVGSDDWGFNLNSLGLDSGGSQGVGMSWHGVGVDGGGDNGGVDHLDGLSDGINKSVLVQVL